MQLLSTANVWHTYQNGCKGSMANTVNSSCKFITMTNPVITSRSLAIHAYEISKICAFLGMNLGSEFFSIVNCLAIYSGCLVRLGTEVWECEQKKDSDIILLVSSPVHVLHVHNKKMPILTSGIHGKAFTSTISKHANGRKSMLYLLAKVWMSSSRARIWKTCMRIYLHYIHFLYEILSEIMHWAVIHACLHQIIMFAPNLS